MAKSSIKRKGRLFLPLLLMLVSAIISYPQTGLARPYLSYIEGLERMAEILGSLHYLDNLCPDANDTATSEEWRHFMDRLIVTQNPSTSERTRLVSSFNRAFHAFSEHHYHCTPAAKAAARLYRQKGEKLSKDLVNRYGR